MRSMDENETPGQNLAFQSVVMESQAHGNVKVISYPHHVARSEA